MPRVASGSNLAFRVDFHAQFIADGFFAEDNLKRLMSSYLLYYHEDRTHLGLAKDTPAGRPTEIRSAHENKIQQDPILSETRRATPSLCAGSVASRAIPLKTKRFFS